ncbi:MAG: YraN family protein [Trueperella sp.]|nr:YraN family protein [Trueperella sp.]
MTRSQLGSWGEDCAVTYLKGQGWEILARNWRTRGGELDVVAFDPQRQALVAVEVKTRRTTYAGTAEEAVTPVKLQRIRGLLSEWLAAKGLHVQVIAVDVIGIQLDSQGNYTVNHVRDAQY